MGSRWMTLAAIVTALCSAPGLAASAFGSADMRSALATTGATDPSDVPTGSQGETDLRTVRWDVGAATTTVTISVDESTFGADQRAQLWLYLLLDTDRNGIANFGVSGARNADGIQIDMALHTLDMTSSTADCQDLSGKIAGAVTVGSTVGNARERFSFTFDTGAVPGGLRHFRWGAFGQSPDPAAAGPWDYLPNGANPDQSAANPGDRRCGATHGGLRLNLTAGIDQVTRRPDGRIRLGGGPLIGNDLYNVTGLGQSRSGSAGPNHTIQFVVSIQNDGSADSFNVKAAGGGPAYAIKYFHGSAEITAAVVAGTYQTPSIGAAGTFVIAATVTVRPSAPVASMVKGVVTITSVGDPSRKDAVVFVGKRA